MLHGVTYCQMTVDVSRGDQQEDKSTHNPTTKESLTTIFQYLSPCMLAIMTLHSESSYTLPKWSNIIYVAQFPPTDLQTEVRGLQSLGVLGRDSLFVHRYPQPHSLVNLLLGNHCLATLLHADVPC